MEARSALDRSRFPIGLLLVVVFFCFTAVSAVRELYRRNQVKEEITTLQAKVEGLEERKQTLAEMLQKLQSPEVLDREARLRLNMQKPGERVYLLRGETWEATTQASSSFSSREEIASDESTRSNPERWFRYFFFAV